jgi:hypothetical protein
VQYVGWLLLIACFVSILIAIALIVRRRLEAAQN